MATHPGCGGCFAFTNEEGNATSIKPITAMQAPFSISAIDFLNLIRFPRADEVIDRQNVGSVVRNKFISLK
jgi:hypothetical protein